jgi:CIC family chloride channel protein
MLRSRLADALRLQADPADVPAVSGFHAAPPRPRVLTLTLFCCVVLAAATTAHLFRLATREVTRLWSDTGDPSIAADTTRWFVVWGIVSGAVLVAACIGRQVERRAPARTGIEAVAASARGENRRISLRASGARAAATWLASIGIASIGRESAIIEMGGSFGTAAGRRFGGRGDALATAGIAAAFAGAYHAPFASVVYLEEHLRISTSRRALLYATTGAAGGYFVSSVVFGEHAIFEAPTASRWETLGLALAVLLPAFVVSRLFRILRVRMKAGAIATRYRLPEWGVVAVFAVAAGAAVATFPSAAGNGMEALRHVPHEPGLALALALGVGKLVGTTAALGSGAPGGAVTPSMGIASGCALLVLLGFENLGLDIGADLMWGVAVCAMAIGVAAGLRSPLLALTLVPELVGDYTMLPVIGIVVAAVYVVDLVVDRLVVRVRPLVPKAVYDEDA